MKFTLEELQKMLQGEAMDTIMDKYEFQDMDWYAFNLVLEALFAEVES